MSEHDMKWKAGGSNPPTGTRCYPRKRGKYNETKNESAFKWH